MKQGAFKFWAIISCVLPFACLTENSTKQESFNESQETFNESLGLEWTRQYDGSKYDLNSVVWTGEKFVAMGSDGFMLTSTDGVSWTYRISGLYADEDVNSVARGNQRIVAVGGGITGTSSDGENWTWTASKMNLRTVTWAGDRFVAIGQDWSNADDGVVFTSSDGLSWQEHSSPEVSLMRSIAWSGKQLVAVGYWGRISTSADGITWISQNSGTTKALSSVTWTGNRYVVVGEEGVVLTSPDAIIWTSRTSNELFGLSTVLWTGNRLVAAGASILTSPDGISWTVRASGIDEYLLSIVWNGNQYVAAGSNGKIMESKNGVTWTDRSIIPPVFISPASLHAIEWSGKLFVAVGYNGTIRTSPDGMAWTNRRSGTHEWLTTVSSSDNGIIVSGGGAFLFSQDGIDWQNLSGQVQGTPVWTGEKWVSVSVTKVMTSSNGLNWATHFSPTPIVSGETMAWTGSRLVAISGFGFIRTSVDGLEWTLQKRVTDKWLRSMVWTGSQLVVVGSGIVLTSPDGETWTVVTEGVEDLSSVTWTGNRLIAVGFNGVVQTSTDGTVWTTEEKKTSKGLYAIATSKNRAIAVGEHGTILSSP